jgi:chemotaxis protein histidine kinase CheA
VIQQATEAYNQAVQQATEAYNQSAEQAAEAYNAAEEAAARAWNAAAEQAADAYNQAVQQATDAYNQAAQAAYEALAAAYATAAARWMQAALQATQTYLAALASAFAAWSAAAVQAAAARDDRIQAAERTYAQRLQDLQSQADEAWQHYESALLDAGCVPGQSTVPGLVAHTLPSGPGSPRRAESGGSVVDRVQTALDVGGCFPLVGEGCDLVNAGISLARGDYLGAGLSLLSVIPVYGDAVGKGGKLARRATKYADEAAAAVRGASNARGVRSATKYGEYVRRADNFKRALSREHVLAALAEKQGKTVKLKRDGTPFDHLAETRNAMVGAKVTVHSPANEGEG